MRVAVYAIVACGSLLAVPTTAHAAFEKEQAEIDGLVAAKKYLSAAQYIDSRPELRAQPRYLRELSHILVTYYAMTFNFRLFSLRDLEATEQIEKVRGSSGAFTILGGDWEKVLRDALDASPDDPNIHFAVGEYLSRGKACGCAKPELFVGANAEEFPHLDAAFRAGIRDYWSLFRMGVHHLSAEPPNLQKAVELFEASSTEKPDFADSHYNAAIAYFWLKDYPAARKHADLAAGRYGDNKLDADSFNVQGRIYLAMEAGSDAEKALRRALELQPSHEGAFVALLDLLRSAKRFPEYKTVASSYIALEYGNTYPFGVYLQSVMKAGVSDADRELGRELAARAYSGPREVGAVFYGLGHLAELDSDRPLAHTRYQRSLEALRQQETAPKGAVQAVTELVRRTAAE